MFFSHLICTFFLCYYFIETIIKLKQIIESTQTETNEQIKKIRKQKKKNKCWN